MSQLKAVKARGAALRQSVQGQYDLILQKKAPVQEHGSKENFSFMPESDFRKKKAQHDAKIKPPRLGFT